MTTVQDVQTRKCPRCKATKPLDQFGVWGDYIGKRAGQPRTYCRACERINSKDAYKKRVERNPRPPRVVKEKSLGWAAAPNGQMLEIVKRGGEYVLRETRY